MTKSNFLLVNLNEPKTKKLAETITSETSRKILNSLAEKENSEAKIAEELQIPISTVHYHLQKLQEAGLVKVEEFHYSPKGREVNHYKLANKYIIIAPGKIEGLKEKLKGILPVALIAVGISVIIKIITSLQENMFMSSEKMAQTVAQYGQLEYALAAPAPAATPDLALWFFLGSMVTIMVYFLISIWRRRK